MSIEFGFYPLRLDEAYRNIRIETLEGFEARAKAVLEEPYVAGDWVYSPPKLVRSFGHESTGVLPYASRVFGLPKTHVLSHSTDEPLRLRFLVWCFGFFVGMRMSDQEAGFLDATPIKPGVSNDIVWFGNSLIIALGLADEFFSMHAASAKIETIVRAAIHSYLLAEIPTLLDYERFVHLYTAVDACFAVRALICRPPKKRVPHAERIAYLCTELSLPVPTWADPSNPYVAAQRNETLHEGLFFDEPWGFSIFGGERHADPQNQGLLLEMQHLICRILMATLGVQDRQYLTSSIADRQRHGVKLS